MIYFILVTLVATVCAEHKVHNIVLYPERHSWCQTTPIKQVVAMQGYESLTIDNHVCVGACYSYSIPRTHPAEPGELIGPYCDSCQPKTTLCYHVTLRPLNKTLQNENNQNSPDQQIEPIRKRVQIITDCSCSSCNRDLKQDECDLDDSNTLELPANLLTTTSQEKLDGTIAEVPELMSLPPTHYSSAPGSVGKDDMVQQEPEVGIERDYHLSQGHRALLKQIQSEEVNFNGLNPEQLVDMRILVDIIQGNDEKLTDRDVIDFVNWINENGDEDNELDALKLKTALDAFHRRELRQKHKKFGLGQQVMETTTTATSPGQKPQQNDEVLVEGSHLGLGHKKGAHIAMGIHHNHKQLNENLIPQDDEEEEEEEEQQQQNQGHLHHKLGDEIINGGSVAHLVMGPHGSLVLASTDGVASEEQTDITGITGITGSLISLPSDEVTPNQEGTVIDYHHDHHLNHKHHHHHHHQQHNPEN